MSATPRGTAACTDLFTGENQKGFNQGTNKVGDLIIMGNEELKNKISTLLPTAVFEETGDPATAGWLNIQVEAADLRALAQQLRNDESLLFDHLFCLTCISGKHISPWFIISIPQHFVIT